MDENSKERQRQRYRRSMEHFVDHEEQRERKVRSKARKAGRQARSRQRSNEDDEPVAFERIRRSTPDPVTRPDTEARDLTGLVKRTVVAVHRGQVELCTGATARLSHRLHLSDLDFRIAVGDEVLVNEGGDTQRVEKVAPRRTVLVRPDPAGGHRHLVLAANVDRAVIVAAASDPPFRPGLVDRFLLALGIGGVEPILCINKTDLLDETSRRELAAAITPYAALGIPIAWCSAHDARGLDELREALGTETTCVFVGHSGVGKSSLLNCLDPQGDRKAGSVREFDGRGRHTTTSSRMATLRGEHGVRVIDTPGVRAFSVEDLPADVIRGSFPEFAEPAAQCRFADCRHVEEPNCAVRSAAEAGAVWSPRYESYRRMLE